MLKSITLVFLIFVSTTLGAEAIYPFESKRNEAQFNHLIQNFRCLVCQNESLADSNAPLAKDLKAEIYTMVLKGQSDSEISNYLLERYGDFVLFKPAFKSLTLLLWLGPGIFLLLGLYIFYSKTRGSA